MTWNLSGNIIATIEWKQTREATLCLMLTSKTTRGSHLHSPKLFKVFFININKHLYKKAKKEENQALKLNFDTKAALYHFRKFNWHSLADVTFLMTNLLSSQICQ